MPQWIDKDERRREHKQSKEQEENKDRGGKNRRKRKTEEAVENEMKKDEMERLLAEKAERNCLGEEEKRIWKREKVMKEMKVGYDKKCENGRIQVLKET